MVTRSEANKLFSKGYLDSWLKDRRAKALGRIQRYTPDEVLARPPEQLAEEVIAEYVVAVPLFDLDNITGGVKETRLDVSRDFNRVVTNRSRPFYIEGSRIELHAPYAGPMEALQYQASSSTMSPPMAVVTDGRVTVSRKVAADALERDRQSVVAGLHEELANIQKHLDFARKDIEATNAQLRTEVADATERRRKKILADRETEAMLGVPLERNDQAASSYRVQPVKRKRLTPTRRQPTEAFSPEPAITDEDFADIIGDITTICLSFERLAITHAELEEERLRDQILTMLGNTYGPASGESFSKRGKSDIYLPWNGGNAIFLAECKWWTGPKNFENKDLPQLLDRYIVWRDTHTAMILFIRNRDATAAIEKAVGLIRGHERYLRDAADIGDVPVFVLHKDGDPDREIKLALVTAVIHQ